MGFFSGKKGKGKKGKGKPTASKVPGRSNKDIYSAVPLGGPRERHSMINGLSNGLAVQPMLVQNKKKLKDEEIPSSLKGFFEKMAGEMAVLSEDKLEKDLENGEKNLKHVLNYFENKKILIYSKGEEYKIRVDTPLFYSIRSILIGAQYFLAEEADLKEFTIKIEMALEKIVEQGEYIESNIEREMRRIGFGIHLKNILIGGLEPRKDDCKKILKKLEDEDKILKGLIIKIRQEIGYDGKLEVGKIDKPEFY